jgi:hypothetical protein
MAPLGGAPKRENCGQYRNLWRQVFPCEITRWLFRSVLVQMYSRRLILGSPTNSKCHTAQWLWWRIRNARVNSRIWLIWSNILALSQREAGKPRQTSDGTVALKQNFEGEFQKYKPGILIVQTLRRNSLQSNVFPGNGYANWGMRHVVWFRAVLPAHQPEQFLLRCD